MAEDRSHSHSFWRKRGRSRDGDEGTEAPESSESSRNFLDIRSLGGLRRRSKSTDRRKERAPSQEPETLLEGEARPPAASSGTDQGRRAADQHSREEETSIRVALRAAERGQHNGPKIELPTENLAVSLRIWDKAYEQLRDREPQLVESYEKILSQRYSHGALGGAMATANLFVDCPPAMRLARMNDVAKRALDKSQRHEAIEEGAEQAINLVNAFADFIKSLLETYPPAAMAWSGVTIALPFLVKVLQVNRELASALEHMMNRSHWYMTICRVLLRDTWPNDSEMHDWNRAVEERVTSLFESFLGFQMKCVCHCYRPLPFLVNVKNALLGISWKAEADGIIENERLVEGDIRMYCSSVSNEVLRLIETSCQQLVKQIFVMSTGLQSINQTLETQHSESKQQHESELTGRFKTTPYIEWMDANPNHIDGTCNWFCGHEKFRNWLQGGSGQQILLVSADPGCGKSVLAKHLVKNILPAEMPTATICYFFFKDNPEQSELASAYAALLHRLLLENRAIANRCKTSITLAGKEVTKHLDSLWALITEALTYHTHGPVVCVLDALDECRPAGLDTFSRQLAGLDMAGRDVRFLLTTRGYPHILDRFTFSRPDIVHLAGENKYEVDQIQKEITLVVDHRLSELAKSRNQEVTSPEMMQISQGLHARGKNQRTYIWVKLVFEVLEAAHPSNADEWEELVSTLPRTATEAYSKLLQNVPDEKREKVRTILLLVLCAYRPLSLRELNIALNVRDRLGAKSLQELKLVSDKDFRKMMVQNCGHFVTEYAGRVYFIHQTAKEFLVAGEDEKAKSSDDNSAPVVVVATSASTTPSWISKVRRASAHGSMAECCIAYLSLHTSIDSAGALYQAWAATVAQDGYNWAQAKMWRSLVDGNPFAEYVTRFWPSHFRHCQTFSPTGELLSDIGDQFQPYYKALFLDFRPNVHPSILATIRTQKLSTLVRDPIMDANEKTEGLGYDRELMGLSKELGLVERGGVSINAWKQFNLSALAALWGHMRLLRECEPIVPSYPISSPISFWRDWPKILGWADTSPSIPPKPATIICAAAGRNIPCVQYLLRAGLSLDSQGVTGKSALHWAAYFCYGDVVDFLLEHGGHVLLTDVAGQTPLQYMLSREEFIHGFEDVARVLVTASNGQGLDLALCKAVRRDWGLTDAGRPSYSATARRRKHICSPAFGEEYKTSFIPWLVSQGADIDALDGEPLMAAAAKPSLYGIVCLLRAGANPKLIDKSHRSALFRAAGVPMPGTHSLHKATVEIARCLLDAGVGTETKMLDGNTALHFVCERQWSGDVELARALIDHGANIEAINAIGERPLQLLLVSSVGHHRDQMADLLLMHGARHNFLDVMQRTPLLRACRYLDTFLMRMLLSNGARVDQCDKQGNTPLHLLFRRDSNPLDQAGRFWGAEPWVEKAIRMLLAEGAPTTVPNHRGRTAVDMAALSGWKWCDNTEDAQFREEAHELERNGGYVSHSERLTIMYSPPAEENNFSDDESDRDDT